MGVAVPGGVIVKCLCRLPRQQLTIIVADELIWTKMLKFVTSWATIVWRRQSREGLLSSV